MNHEFTTLYLAAKPWLQQVLQHLAQPYALVELFAAACGLLGSLLLALKGRVAPWGWAFFALSNIGWIAFAYGHSHWFLLVQQIGFSITSAVGIWKWLIQPIFDGDQVGPEKALIDMEARKDAAYLERNRLVALLSTLFPAGRARTAIDGWSEDWHGCVYINLPTGQVSWHYHDSQAHLFAHLPPLHGRMGRPHHRAEVRPHRCSYFTNPLGVLKC